MFPCAYCGAETRQDSVKAAFCGPQGWVVVEDVPARVCPGCGEFAGVCAEDGKEFRLGLDRSCGLKDFCGQRGVVGRVLGGPDALHARSVERVKDILCLLLRLAVGG
jgi:YgiT-type zinc finger domain-containing protein